MAVEYDLKIDQGATFYKKLTWLDGQKEPIDLSGYTAKMEIKGVLRGKAVLSLSTDDQTIKVFSTGIIEIFMSDEQTKLLNSKEFLYDLFLSDPSGKITNLIGGKIICNLSVTSW